MEHVHGGNGLGEVTAIQKAFVAAGGCTLSLENWAKGLVTKRLKPRMDNSSTEM